MGSTGINTPATGTTAPAPLQAIVATTADTAAGEFVQVRNEISLYQGFDIACSFATEAAQFKITPAEPSKSLDATTTATPADMATKAPPSPQPPVLKRAASLAPLELSADLERQPVPITRASNTCCLDMSFASYLELLAWSGRQWRVAKRGAIPGNLPPIFEPLGLPEESWLELLRGFHGRFRRAAGRPESMVREAAARGRRYLHGMPAYRRAYADHSTAILTDRC